MSKPNNNRRLNCAIYTRKSTDEGLPQGNGWFTVTSSIPIRLRFRACRD